MKILYVTTVGITMIFFKDLVKQLLDEGHEVDILCNEEVDQVPEFYSNLNCKVYHHCCSRIPFSSNNLRAIGQIKKVVQMNNYDVVHCHTPIASICTRLACRKLRKTGLKVFYTAHGFHFYKGAPLKNWLIYYPIEKLCARYTDTLITINHEDYEMAQKKMKANRVTYIPGVGIDVEKFRCTAINRASKRLELGVPVNAFLLASVGELNKNKNHEVVIRAISKLKNQNIHYVIAGRGPLGQYLMSLSEDLGISSQVHLLGYRTDVAEIYKASDVCCFPSIREGLGLAAIEAMAAGLPVIAAENRGTREFVQVGKNGYTCRYNDAVAFAENIRVVMDNNDLYKMMAKNAEKTAERYHVFAVIERVKFLYAQE